jgi:hypothetical protein
MLVRRETDTDLAMMVEAVRSGNFDALVMDAITVQWLANSWEACDLQALGETIEQFNLANAFAPDADNRMIDLVSKWVRARTLCWLGDLYPMLPAVLVQEPASGLWPCCYLGARASSYSGTSPAIRGWSAACIPCGSNLTPAAMPPVACCSSIIRMQQEQNVVDMLDEVFVKGASSPKCGKRIASANTGHGVSGVSFARVRVPQGTALVGAGTDSS